MHRSLPNTWRVLIAFAVLAALVTLIVTTRDDKRAHAAHAGDTGRVVFSSTRDGDHEIYTMGLDGSNVKQLTDNTYTDKDPSWSTDGKIAFTSDRDGNNEIYTMNYNGTDVTRITNNAADDEHPSWGEDDYLVWDRQPSGEDSEIEGMFDQGVTEGDTVDGVVVAPTDLTNNTVDDTRPSVDDSTGDVAYAEKDGSGTYQITIQHEDGTTTTLAASGNGDEWDADYSPDDTQFVYTKKMGANADIYTMNVDGTNRNLVVGTTGSDTRPQWWPSAAKIEYTSDVSGDTEVYKVNPDGTNQVDVSNNSADDNASEVRPVDAGSTSITSVDLNDDPNDITKQQATVYFDHNDTAATFECQIDDLGWSSCTSPVTYTGLDPALGHQVDVRATVNGLTEAPDSTAWTP